MKIFKNGFLRGALVLAFCLCLTLSHFSGVTFVKAASHTHAFTEGVCSCGSIKIEAEDGDIEGTSQYPTVAPDMIENKAEASNGKEIGCFAVVGNSVTWTFNLTKAVSDVYISFSMKSFVSSEDMSGFKLTLNGAELAWKEGSKLTCTYNAANPYQILDTVKFSADTGDLVVKLEIASASAVANIDYLILNLVEGAQGEQIIDPRNDPKAVKIEAEDGVIVGTSRYPSVAPDMIEIKEGASNGKEIGCFDVVGNTVSWTFDFASAAENVRVFFYARSLVDKPTDGFGIYVDETKIEWVSKSFAKTAELAVPYRMYYSEAFSVAAGKHVVKLEVLDASQDKCAVNFDYVMLSGYGDVTVTPIIEDNNPPVISQIAFDKLSVGKESKISFTVVDNVSAVEKITTTVKVFYDYEGENQEEITLVDGKFTPSKDGVYTVLVTATDEAGNKAEKTYSSETILDPTDDPNAVKVEAEMAVIAGTSHYPNIAPDMIEYTDRASGGAEIGCFDVSGNTAQWTFNFESAAQNVRVFFYACSFVNGPTDGFGIYVDDNLVEWGSVFFEKTSSYDNPYKAYYSKGFSVAAGKHVVKLEVLDASQDKCAVNFDYVMLAGYGDVNVRPVLPDREGPAIGDITVGTPELNKEITINCDITDNESSRENINTLVRVWLDYKGDNEEEVEVVDGKFTPTKNGEYTVFIRAVDENGNMSDKTYSFTIGNVETDDNWNLTVKKQMPSWAIGLIIVACAVVVAGGLTAYELYKRKNNQ